MDNITVINLKALVERVLWCRVSWPRAKNVEPAGRVLKWFDLKIKNLILKLTAEFVAASYMVEFFDRVPGWQILWPRVVILSFATACYDIEFYGRELRCRVLRPRVVILSSMAASYDRMLWCVVILSFMPASNIVEFCDRVLWYWASWARAVMSSELTACQNVLRYCKYRKSFREKKSLI